MSTDAFTAPGPLEPFAQLRYGREIVHAEGQALIELAQQLDDTFCSAVELLFRCTGNVIVSGMGKAGLIGQKISATLASTGTRSHFLHPAEAFHGDLGRIHQNDVALILSQSGETEEVCRLLPSLTEFGTPIIAITARTDSTLGQASQVTLALGSLDEVCSLGLAPSTTTTAMLALGDALALVVSRRRDFGAEDFARFHPGGSLGRKLSKVEQCMRPLHQCRLARADQSVREVLTTCARPGRRTGAIMLVNEDGCLQGIFTDSDLARLFEEHRESQLDQPICRVMTQQPVTIAVGSKLRPALDLLANRKISELPVVDEAHRPAGMIDLTDVASILPAPESEAETPQPPTIDSEPSPTIPFPGQTT